MFIVTTGLEASLIGLSLLTRLHKQNLWLSPRATLCNEKGSIRSFQVVHKRFLDLLLRVFFIREMNERKGDSVLAASPSIHFQLA